MAGKPKKAEWDSAGASLADILKKASPHGYAPSDIGCWISTGVDLFDWTLGGRGFPCGRVHEAYGPESSGKTTLALQCARTTQAAGGEVVYIDTDGLDLGLARKLGVDTDRMFRTSPFWLEEVHDLIEKVVVNRERATTPTLIVVDCIAMCLARDYVENPVDKSVAPAQEARLNARFFGRPWNDRLRSSNICLLLLNQPRDKIGVMFGDKETTPGGRVLRHACCIRLKLTKGAKIQSFYTDDIVGHRVIVEIVKNKTTGRNLTVELSAYLDRGIDNVMSSFGYVCDEMKDSTGRITYANKQWFRPQFYKWLMENPAEIELFREYARKVWMGEGVVASIGQ